MAIRFDDDSWTFKIIIAGEAWVGKTTLINQYVYRTFSSEYRATIGAYLLSKKLMVRNLKVNLQIYDIAGQTLFHEFRKKFFTNSQGGFLVFDLTMPNSLESLHPWIEEIYEVNGDSIPLILLGNKVDLRDLCSVTLDDVSKFMKQYPNISLYHSTSALAGDNVELAFSDLVSQFV